MAEPLKVKGLGLMGVVAAINATERFRALLPPPLQHYVAEPILASSWYPAEDFVGLLEVLARTVDPKLVPGDPYRFFGRAAAQRDIKGNEDLIPEKQRAVRHSVYRRSLGLYQTLADRVTFALSLSRIYYSSGHYRVKRPLPNTLRLVLQDFPLVTRRLCAVTSGYLEETFQEGDWKAQVVKGRCRDRGGPECVWEICFAPEVDLASLSAFDGEAGVIVGPKV